MPTVPVNLRDAFGSSVLCRRCKGRGTHSVTTGGKGRPPIVIETPCPACAGAGVVPARAGLGL